MKIYKVLFFISLFLNFIMGFLVYRIPSDYHLRYLKEAKYLLAFTKEVIIENKAKINPDSKFMKNHLYFQANEGEKNDTYLFDLNKELQIYDSKSNSGFFVNTDNNGLIIDFGWYKP